MSKRIDAHMHVCQWYIKDGRTAFEALRTYQKEAGIDAVDIMCCSNQGNLWSGYEMDQNIIAAITKMEVPSTYIHGCMYIPKFLPDGSLPAGFDFEDQLAELKEIGFDGVKFCEFKPDSYKVHQMERREEAFEKYFGWCEAHHFPMCWHIADPDSFWDADRVPEWARNANWAYTDGTYPSYESLCEKTYALLDRHPNLHVMLAHAFFLSEHPDQVRALLRKYPRVTLDLAPGWEMFDGFRLYHDDWYEIFRTWSDRILYATDATMDSGTEYCGLIADRVYRFLATDETFGTPGNHTARGIRLEEEHLEKILCTNARRIVGAQPRPIDRSALREYIRKYLPIMPETRNKAMIEDYLKRHLL